MRPWYAILFRGGAFSRANRGWLAGLAQSALAAALLLSGVVFLAIVLTLAVQGSATEQQHSVADKWYFVLQVLVAVSLICVGAWQVIRLLWKVGVSAERRSAIVQQAVGQAGEMELVRELSQRRDDLPTVPVDYYPPHQGIWKKFRLVPSPRNLWALITAGAFSIVFVVLTTILLLTASHTINVPKADWFAAALTVPIALAACWAIFQFFRQFLKLTGIGPTAIEIDRYPLIPGEEYQVTLTQTGRVRLQLLDVELVCDEEATFNEGTDVRTERATVFSHRLMRRRGIALTPDAPWRTDFKLTLPTSAIHSFRSRNNRIQWKIVVTAKANNWPRLKRHFAFTVHPRSFDVTEMKRSERNRVRKSASK